MNGKGFKSSNLAVAIATSLAVSGAMTPTLVHAKGARDAIIGTGADAIIGTGRSKATSSSDAIIGTGKGPKHANNAIIGTGADAIIGTGADAIIGTGADAIIGTGRSKATSSSDAIIGTGKGPKHANNAIIGTGADAIIGTGADAIIGTGADAIIGTGADAIIGTGADAIIGTGRSKASSSSDAIIGTGKRVVVLMGPIDGVDTATNTISVLNRTLKVRSAQAVHDALAAGQQLMASVTGQLSASGKLEQMKLSYMPADYVAGASKIVLSGRVDRVDSTLGQIQIGGVTADVTAAISAKPVAVGSIVLLVGTQPTRQGIVITEKIYSK